VLAALGTAAVPAVLQAAGSAATLEAERWFKTSDGVRLHYSDSGAVPPGGLTLLLVPGWTMPAWIWSAQIAYFSASHRVIAFDPRGQGQSDVPAAGYTYARRAQDIRELIASSQATDVVLVGWSLGVLECLQAVHDSQTAGLALPLRGLVLVDNSVGEGPPPKVGNSNFFSRLRSKRQDTVRGFVRAMFKTERPDDWLDALTKASLRTPLNASIALLSQGTPREFWRDALYAVDRPVLYAYTQRLAEQGRLAAAHRASIESVLFEDVGHALFVDDALRFNRLLEGFIARLPSTAGPAR
jgi:microsomal epoxide hydrolase